MTDQTRLKRIRYRAWHRGTREADFLVGGFCDRYLATWDEAALVWFEGLLNEQDVDIIAWAFGAAEVPERLHGAMLDALMKLDYVGVTK